MEIKFIYYKTYLYNITAKKEFRDYGLRDQMRRAVVSISSNIVEGFEKNNNNELVRYLKIAKGSAGELRNQLYIAKEVSYISQKDFIYIFELLVKLSSQIGAFINYLQIKKNKKEFIKK